MLRGDYFANIRIFCHTIYISYKEMQMKSDINMALSIL